MSPAPLNRSALVKRALAPARLGTTVAGLTAVLVGTVLSVLGVLGALSGPSASTAAVLGVLTLVATALLLERVFVLGSVEVALERVSSGAEHGARLVYVNQFEPFEAFASDATDLLIIGYSKFHLVVQSTEFIRRLLERGCTVRFMVISPDSTALIDAVADSTIHSRRRFRSDIEGFVETIRTLRTKLSAEANERLIVRPDAGAPSAGIGLASDGRTTRLQAYFYPYFTDPGERLGVETSSDIDPVTVAYFRARYERLWADRADAADPTLA